MNETLNKAYDNNATMTSVPHVHIVIKAPESSHDLAHKGQNIFKYSFKNLISV